MSYDLLIGIDPCKNTGVAVRDKRIKTGCDYTHVFTTDFFGLQEFLEGISPDLKVLIYLEVTDLKVVFKGKQQGRSKGADNATAINVGSCLREMALLKGQIEYIAKRDKKDFTLRTIYDAELVGKSSAFVKMATGYSGKLNNHECDAMMFIAGL
jgi:hypothetical protein